MDVQVVQTSGLIPCLAWSYHFDSTLQLGSVSHKTYRWLFERPTTNVLRTQQSGPLYLFIYIEVQTYFSQSLACFWSISWMTSTLLFNHVKTSSLFFSWVKLAHLAIFFADKLSNWSESGVVWRVFHHH